MEIPVKLNGQRQTVKVVFAQPEDLKFVVQWKVALGNDQNPLRVDTVEFAQLAVKRYEASKGTGIYANTLAAGVESSMWTVAELVERCEMKHT